MKKQIVTMLCGAVAVALAVPAFSSTATLSGQIRTQGVTDNVQIAKKAQYRKFVSERINPKLTIAVNDMVSVVYAGEIDLDWGVNQVATAGFDGAQSGDGVNLETKNLYTSVKLGGDYNLGFTAGLQPIADGIQNMYLRDDIAGLTVTAKAGAVDLGAGWLKIAEEGGSPLATFDATTNPNATTLNDDWDIWFVKAGFVPAEGSKAGVELYRGTRNINSNNDNTLMTIALTGSTKVAGFGVDAFIAMQSGKDEVNGNENDRSATAASVLVSQKFSDVLSGDLRLIYISADTSDDQDNSWQYQYAAQGHMLNFMGSNMNIMFANAYKTGTGAGFRDNLFTVDAVPTDLTSIGGTATMGAGTQAMNSFGLIAAIANAQYNFAPYYFKGAVGYFMTASKKADFGGALGEVELDGTNLGLELFGQVGTKIADGANVYVRGDYLMIGKAFNGLARGQFQAAGSTIIGEDPYNPFMVSVGIDVPF